MADSSTCLKSKKNKFQGPVEKTGHIVRNMTSYRRKCGRNSAGHRLAEVGPERFFGARNGIHRGMSIWGGC